MPRDEENIMKLLKRRCLIPFNNVTLTGYKLKAVCDRFAIPYVPIQDDTLCIFKNGKLIFQEKDKTNESDIFQAYFTHT